MKKFTILCDADDTIEDFLPYWLEELNLKYGLNVKKNEVKSWDLAALYPTLTKEQIFEPIFQKEFWLKITPIENSGYYMKKLIEEGHDVYIVTSANFETSDAKAKKLLELFPFLDRTKIIMTHNKQLINGDILIDDGIHNLVGGKYIRFLFNQPHNEYFDEKECDIMRVYSWEEVYNKISFMAQKE